MTYSFLILLISSIAFQTKTAPVHFQYAEYNSIISNLKRLAVDFPQFCKLIDLKPNETKTTSLKCGDQECEYLALQITNFGLSQDHISQNPQVLFIGSMRGDDRLSANIVFLLAESILYRIESHQDINDLVQRRNMIFYPIANPYGYYYRIPHEILPNMDRVDPNLDFPFLSDSTKSFSTNSAKSIENIYKRFLIQLTLVYQDEAYPWSLNEKFDAPDAYQMNKLAIVYRDKVNNFAFEKSSIKKIATDENLQLKTGIFEDFVYSASWINENYSSSFFNITNTSNLYNAGSSSFRSLCLRIGAASEKAPEKGYLPLSGYNSESGLLYHGIIPIHIKAAIGTLTFVEPYIKTDETIIYTKSQEFFIGWRICGSLTKMTKLGFFVEDRLLNDSTSTIGLASESACKILILDNCFKLRSLIKEDFQYPVKIGIKIEFEALVDHEASNFPLQSFFSHAHSNESYKSEYGGYSIKTAMKIEEEIIINNRSDIIEDKKFSKLKIHMINCLDYSSIGSIDIAVNIKDNKVDFIFAGTLSIGSNNLKAHLHKYAGVFRCSDGLGPRINLNTFMPDDDFENSTLFSIFKNELDYRFSIVESRKIINSYEILNYLIGRGVSLERSPGSEVMFMGEILPNQPESCSKNNVGCIGFDLANETAYCSFFVEGRNYGMRMELTIIPGKSIDTVIVSGLISKHLYIRYFSDSSIFISLGYEMKLLVANSFQIPNFYLIEEQEISISPKNILGNMLHLYYYALGGVSKISTCNVVLEEPGFRFEQKAIEEYNNSHKGVPKEKVDLSYYIFIGLGLFSFVVFVLCIIRRSLNRLKQKSLASMIDVRKEAFQRSETARTITMSRNATLITTMVTSVDRNEKTENTERVHIPNIPRIQSKINAFAKPIDAILEENETPMQSVVIPKNKDPKEIENLDDLEHGDFKMNTRRSDLK